VPFNASVSTSGAVFGSVGRSQRLKLGTAGCGDWTVANVAGPLQVSLAGSGDVMAGSAGSAEVSVAGSGDVRLASISNGLEASVAGSGDIRAASVGGRVKASIAGSGDIVVDTGRMDDVDASIAGSGDVRIEGVARSVDASIIGSGDVRVAQVTGAVNHSVMGSGTVMAGDRRYGAPRLGSPEAFRGRAAGGVRRRPAGGSASLDAQGSPEYLPRLRWTGCNHAGRPDG
jgi:hypothetical protein